MRAWRSHQTTINNELHYHDTCKFNFIHQLGAYYVKRS